jgi:flagellar hook assembly protein FlgD
VKLDVFNILGQKIKTIVNSQVLEAGFHQVSWNGINDANQAVASGIYIFRMVSGKTVKLRKGILTR